MYNLILIKMDSQTQDRRLRDNFLRTLSNYSVCIQPYLRNIQDRYAAAYYIVEGEKVDLT